jgi:leader peptidase (prepilin peptidase)/N-methyltransferase
MLSSIAVAAAGLPVALATERAIVRLAATPVASPALPWQTPGVRATMARIFAVALVLVLLSIAIRFPAADAAVTGVVATALLICCATDLLAYRVPNIVTMPALAVVLGAAALGAAPALGEALLGAGACGGALLAVALATRGGLGGGDVKLVVLIGAALGVPAALFALAAGIVAGSTMVIALHATRRLQRSDVFPYAPFLSIAALVTLLW